MPAEWLPRQRPPARALHGRSRGRQLLLEGVKAAEVALERRGQLAVRRAVAAVGRQVLPEQRVQDVPREIERQALFELADVVEAPLMPRVLELAQRVVRTLHVRRVVGVVMQLEKLTRHVRLERVVAVRELGKRVHRVATQRRIIDESSTPATNAMPATASGWLSMYDVARR